MSQLPPSYPFPLGWCEFYQYSSCRYSCWRPNILYVNPHPLCTLPAVWPNLLWIIFLGRSGPSPSRWDIDCVFDALFSTLSFYYRKGCHWRWTVWWFFLIHCILIPPTVLGLCLPCPSAQKYTAVTEGHRVAWPYLLPESNLYSHVHYGLIVIVSQPSLPWISEKIHPYCACACIWPGAPCTP